MPLPNEIGTLRARPNGESVFVGSSSGVFFINTVRRAFAQAAANTRHNGLPGHEHQSHISTSFSNLPSPEDCIIGTETHSSERPLSNRRVATTDPAGGVQNEVVTTWSQTTLEDFGELPPYDAAKELLVTYFRTWHPLFPFLHGPTCLMNLEEIYMTGVGKKPKLLPTAIIFQCMFHIAKLDAPYLFPSEIFQCRHVEQLMLALGVVSLRSDLASLQALLAAQLYLVAVMDFRSASTVGGMVIRSVFKLGLHRCPVRYSGLTNDDRDIRKRIFWSAYCLDRYVSQTLGHPLGYQDSDFDVCEPGKPDLHEPVSRANFDQTDMGTSPAETILHLPANHPSRSHVSPQQNQTGTEIGHTEPTSTDNSAAETCQDSQQRRENQNAQPQFVKCSQLTGRVMELFHKSIHARQTNQQDVLFLRADIDAWGNDLPYPSETPSIDSTPLNQDVFFRVAQQHLLLLVNRPSLSLDPASAEFNHAAQICIGAARSIIRSLESHLATGGSIFWPGLMNAVWMSGLVMAFTCQLKVQEVSRSFCDIASSLKILKAMKIRWRMAQNCEAVLEMLLNSVQNSDFLAATSASGVQTNVDDHQESRPRKRPHSDDYENTHGVESNAHDVRPRRRVARHFSHYNPIRSQPAIPRQGVSAQQRDITRVPLQRNEDPLISTATQPLEAQEFYRSRHPDQFHDPTISELPSHSISTGIINAQVSGSGMDLNFYDVFDGAAWGPLFDLTEDMGGFIQFGD